MSEEKLFVGEKIINAPADLIYRAFTSATALREWLCDVSTTNPDQGGWIYLAWNRGYFASGYFTKLVPNKVVSFTWIGKDEPKWSQVDVVISPVAEGEVFKVELEHTGMGPGEAWEKTRKEISKGWALGMENLKATLEDGRDLRFMNRPLIGIYPEDLTYLSRPTIERLNIPVEYGVLVTEVVPEYGAEQAGIQPDDVIVAIDGAPVKRIKSLGAIIDKYSPGDQIEVVVYRGPEKLTFDVNTLAQKVQALPDSPEDLAKEIESRSSKVLETLKNVLNDVTDAEASYSPGPEMWSVKETLVHLIHTERDMHSWINDLVSGQERFYDQWPGDRLLRIRATLTTYPTVNDLMAELRRSLKETVASVAFMDQRFTRRKASYWRLGNELLGTAKHIYEHIGQIEDNIQSARNTTTG